MTDDYKKETLVPRELSLDTATFRVQKCECLVSDLPAQTSYVCAVRQRIIIVYLFIAGIGAGGV